jgi:hypothetical protein
MRLKGHLGAVLTSGLAVLALALAILQLSVLFHSAQRGAAQATAVQPIGPTNRFSAPGGRSAIPWAPFDKAQQIDREGRSPSRPPEEHRTPPQQRYHSTPPRAGPQPPRKLTA